MSTEELLKPRYKVIADWPGGVFKSGELIDPHPVYGYNIFPYPEKFPHLFKPLQWWEDRKPENMPKYLTYKSSPDSNLYIIKVDRHFRNTFGLMNKVGCISDGEYYSYSKTLPSTEHEFLVWKAITHPNRLTAEERTKISEHKMTNEQVAMRISGLDSVSSLPPSPPATRQKTGKTKEQCLKDRDVSIDRWPDTRDLIYMAMDDYAKQFVDTGSCVLFSDAIEFEEWILNENTYSYFDGKWSYHNDIEWTEGITTSELYNLFLQSKKTKINE